MPTTDDRAVTAGDRYQLRVPAWAETYGQGEPPRGLTISRGGETRVIPWGALVKASATCDRPGPGIANMDAEPPLVDCGVIEELGEQFELVEAASTTTE